MRVIADKKKKTTNGDSSFLQVFCFIVLTVILANSTQNQEAGEARNKETYLSCTSECLKPDSFPVLWRKIRIAFQVEE